MTWLLVAVSSYFLFAIVNLVDKNLLGRRIPNPQVYTFYIGSLGILLLGLAPFGFLTIPKVSILILALAAGIFHTLGVFVYLVGLKKFEVSRIIPAMGAFLPIFILGLTLIFSKKNEVLAFPDIIAFISLLLGSFLITLEKKKNITLTSIKIAILAAFFFALYFITAKFVYLEQPFISGLIWTRVGAFLLALCFLFSKAVREDIKKPRIIQGKTWAIFLSNEITSSSGFILQNWAIALAPIIYLGIISALEGIQYVFILIFVILLSLKFPQILKEEISKEIIFQKFIAILLIGGGLMILYLF